MFGDLFKGTNRKFRAAALVMAAVVVFVSVYSLILPALTIETDVASEEPGMSVNSELIEAESITSEEDPTEENSIEGNTEDPARGSSEDMNDSEDPAPEVPEGSNDPAAPADTEDTSENGGADDPADESQDGSASNEPGEAETADNADPEKADEETSENTADKPAGAGTSETAQNASEGENTPVRPDAAAMPAVVLTEKTNNDEKGTLGQGGMTVSVDAPEGTFPEGVQMKVAEVTEDRYVIDAVDRAVDSDPAVNGTVERMQAVDITFFDKDGREIEPLKPVKVKISAGIIDKTDTDKKDEALLVHVPDKDKVSEAGVKPSVVPQEDIIGMPDKNDNGITFRSGEFSVYVIVYIVEPEDGGDENGPQDLEASRSGRYKITVTYDDSANIPEGASLEVSEILPDGTGNGEYEAGSEGTAYEEYEARTAEALGWGGDDIAYLRIFDIRIVDTEGNKVTIAAPVDVKIELADRETAEDPGITKVVHFAGDESGGDVIDSVEADGGTVSFAAEGFSAYAIVEGPPASSITWNKASSLDDLTARGYYIGQINGYYFRNDLVGNSSRMGIGKTKPPQSYPATEAVLYYFEQAGDGKYYAYCIKDGQKQYVINKGNNSLLLGNESEKTAFTATVDENGRFRFNNGQWYWNMQGGANGTRFCSYNQDPGQDNNLMYLWYGEERDSDPYDLDGSSYGMISWNGGPMGKAVMAAGSDGALDAKQLTVMSNSNDNEDKLFVPNDSDISMWTFEWAQDDKYYLKTNADGSLKYLKIGADGASLVSVPDDDCLIRFIPGSGDRSGQFCLKSENGTLTYSGSVDTGFDTSGTAGSEWLHFVELSELTSDYVMPYSAKKISVSDPGVETGSQIIVYTRKWNDTTKKYEFYAIDHDGSLVKCTESGDSIEWVGTRLNTMLWQFTEYTYDDGTPNYYYELYNPYSGKFIAPQVMDGQILSDEPIGINLEGRRKGRYYSSIIAWDDYNYNFAALKAEDGNIVSCPKSEAMDFYFAILDETQTDDQLHTVDTVNNKEHGITMKMKNFSTRQYMSNFLGSDAGGATLELQQGLLSTNLEEDGYPTVTKSGASLGTMYQGDQEVNHLFIESTYHASGYYEFDSSQNFASLKNDRDGDGIPDFLVYKELGSYDSGGDKKTLKHGQFFPYNDLQPGLFCTVNGQNLYTARAELLPEGDPRKYEQLYLIQNTDCQFGVELSASFVQTPSGLDEWKHDIIYEFTGDDDFWLYVDGELVIDLGGIHSAVPGSVNFRHGTVNVNGTSTTLKELFYNNYLGRGHTEQQAQDYVDGLFELNSDGEWVFKDNTTHTMKIFYMERGGGASNLFMRFNLASVKPGTVVLKKELTGLDSPESVLAEFPYQIKYKKKNDPTEYYLANNVSDGEGGIINYVHYNETVNPTEYRDHLTIDGKTYNDVFMLKPGEEVEITFPVFESEDEKVESYSIVECGVDTGVYDEVRVDKDVIEGVDVPGSENRKDYETGYATTDDRPNVGFKNHAAPDAIRTLTATKKLYDESGIHTPEHELRDDDAVFDFRLYLATEFDESLNESPANMHTYHVKDPSGNYCRWDAQNQVFISLGKDDFDELTAAERTAASFSTSMNGAISKIPAYYTVEIRNVLAGTQYRLEERPTEIPDGYAFQEYIKDESAEIRQRNSVPGVVDTVASGKDPHVDVCNLRGFGLRVEKEWSDKDFMEERDPAYFALFLRGEDGDLTLISEPNTVRQLPYGADSVYWFFLTLPYTGIEFDNYEIREVRLSESDPDVDDEGVVTNYGTATPVGDGEETDFIGKQEGESVTSLFRYVADYEKGTVAEDSRVRVDKVTNSRPGVIFVKQDMEGNALSGAVFTLRDEDGGTERTYTSDENGYIATAFLREGVDYTLTEDKTPKEFHGLQEPVVIRQENGVVTVSGIDEDLYSTDVDEDGNDRVIIKNRPLVFRSIKKDANTNIPMAGVHFALHREVTVGEVTSIDLNPMPGYEDLVTLADGTIPGLDNTLPAGTFELREKSAPEGYRTLPYIRFTKSVTGKMTLGSHPDGVTVTDSIGSDGSISYTMSVPNSKVKNVRFMKVDIGNIDRPLPGAEFDLYAVDTTGGEDVKVEPALYTGIVSRQDGLFEDADGNTVFVLAAGRYHLVETKAPEGYAEGENVVIDIDAAAEDPAAVTYDDGSSISLDGTGKSYNSETATYTLKITNTSGYELPSSGGPGTWTMYVLGALLMGIAAVMFVAKSRTVPVDTLKRCQ